MQRKLRIFWRIDALESTVIPLVPAVVAASQYETFSVLTQLVTVACVAWLTNSYELHYGEFR